MNAKDAILYIRNHNNTHCSFLQEDGSVIVFTQTPSEIIQASLVTISDLETYFDTIRGVKWITREYMVNSKHYFTLGEILHENNLI